MNSQVFCYYCDSLVYYEQGWMMLEDIDDNRVVHEECYQLSGEDNGLVKEIHQFD